MGSLYEDFDIIWTRAGVSLVLSLQDKIVDSDLVEDLDLCLEFPQISLYYSNIYDIWPYILVQSIVEKSHVPC